jgi:diaminohydroxyphosphoribosylaminopyrimidine deaminase/5-amino-6-(5-phosphoribosylamino)uracil reductase
MTDLDFMRRAQQLALKAKGKTSPNPMVGAVVVKGGRVIAEGWHRRCGADHAEAAALKKAGARAVGARLYVTLEPCYHYGRTPPCVDRVVQSGVAEVIIGMKDPNLLTDGKSIRKLRRAGIKTRVGILQKELEVMNEAFVKYTKTGMPFVAAKCAQSLDGKVATAAGESKWITSEKTRQFSRAVRDEFDAILVGINTVVKDDPLLTGHSKTKRLIKVVVDSSLKISPEARLFGATRPSDCVIATTDQSSPKKRAALSKRGARVMVCPRRDGQVDLKSLFQELAKQNVTSILLEGGARVIGNALKNRLIDKMYIYIAPKILGDRQALSSVVGMSTAGIEQSVQLTKVTLQTVNTDILVQGYVNYHRG